jgi:hypothetical protein
MGNIKKMSAGANRNRTHFQTYDATYPTDTQLSIANSRGRVFADFYFSCLNHLQFLTISNFFAIE